MLEHFLAPWRPLLPLFEMFFLVLEKTAFLWGPVLLVWLAQKYWLEYKRAAFIKKFSWVMLEVKVPRIIDKTPIAMELVLQAMYQGGNGNWYERWWLGKVKPWFSLELVSIEGEVRFFIRTPNQYKKIIETHIYAQYPDIEVHEVEDYVGQAPYMHQPGEWELWGAEFGLTKADPFPIKTYVDYGLDSAMLKEEQKSDPITNVIEYLGDIGPHQQVWIQIMIQPTGERFQTPGTHFGKHDWKKEGKLIIKKLQEEMKDPEGKGSGTKRQQEIISAIERSLSKLGFDCGIRTLYLAQRDHFDAMNIPGLVGAFRQYSSQDLNGFKPTLTPGFDYPWQDYKGWREGKVKRKLFDAYVRRSYFYSPYKKKPFVLNTEELATIYHFPGGVAETPTFSRIESRKGEPPANLPL